jgi:hypothetical protein
MPFKATELDSVRALRGIPMGRAGVCVYRPHLRLCGERRAAQEGAEQRKPDASVVSQSDGIV